MAGASVEVTGLAELQARLANLGNGKATKAVSKEIAIEAQVLVGEGFQKGQAPDGSPWEPIKYRSGQPLRDSGRLGASVIVEDTGKGFKVGTNVLYANVHQHGAVITVKRAKQLYSAKLGRGFGKSVKIPARPFLPTDAPPGPWMKRFEEVAEDTIEALFP